MKNIYLNGLNNIAPTELRNPFIQQSMMMTLLRSCNEPQIDQLAYQLYELTEEEIKIVEGKS
jgi:hypothetical protein